MSSHLRRLAVPLAAAGLALVWSATGLTQQPQIITGPAGQPGITWSEEQLKQAVAPVRVGRKLTPTSWPNGAKVAVCLSYDVDNEYLSNGMALPTPTSQGEFGAVSGLPRVLDLLDRHQIPASFYIPASSAILHPQMLEQIKIERPTRDRAAWLDS